MDINDGLAVGERAKHAHLLLIGAGDGETGLRSCR
jgi:hypothetical protein